MTLLAAATRSRSMQAICMSNQHSVYLAANLYAADFDGWMGPPYSEYAAKQGDRFADGFDKPAMPPQLAATGFANSNTGNADFFVAMDYISAAKNYQGAHGTDVFVCPLARDKLRNISPTYDGNIGNVECHYFFSSLITAPTTDPKWPRTNTRGPYRPEELMDRAQTLYTGDALAITDAGTPNKPLAAMVATFDWEDAGKRSTCFGAMVKRAGKLADNPEYYDRLGPVGAFWDGHVETVRVPPMSDTTALRKCLTRDGTADK